MKEAIGNSFLISISIVLIALIAAILVASFIHSKAYKAKNKIISVLEKHDGYSTIAEKGNNSTQADIYYDLGKMGFRVATSQTNPCKNYDIVREEKDEFGNPIHIVEKNVKDLVHDRTAGNYDFCLYKVTTSRGFYYHVIVYTHYDIPIIGEFLSYPISGDSRTIYSDLKG